MLKYVVLIGVLLSSCVALAADEGLGVAKRLAPLPDPDGKPAAADKPVKVFILLGQSNMLGFGRVGPTDKIGTLEYMVKGKYAHLIE